MSDIDSKKLAEKPRSEWTEDEHEYARGKGAAIMLRVAGITSLVVGVVTVFLPLIFAGIMLLWGAHVVGKQGL
jgi:hypothetical protein